MEFAVDGTQVTRNGLPLPTADCLRFRALREGTGIGFFTRKREELRARGIDPGRIPPGQYYTERFPVLHAGRVPDIDLEKWDFTGDGLVASPQRWNYQVFSRCLRIAEPSTFTASPNGPSSIPTGKGCRLPS